MRDPVNPANQTKNVGMWQSRQSHTHHARSNPCQSAAENCMACEYHSTKFELDWVLAVVW